MIAVARPIEDSFARKAARREARLIDIAVWVTLIGGFGITTLIYAPVVWLGVLSVSGDPLAEIPILQQCERCGALTFG